MAEKAALGVDVGGTFTDLVAVVNGQFVTAKVQSTPKDQSVGVYAAVVSCGIDASSVATFSHGTTVATNTLLERRGGRTALITTSGFRDIVEIGRQNRASLYDLTRHRPPSLVPRDLRFTIRERMGPDGVVVPLDEADLAHVAAALADAGVEAVAVCLLFGFLHPQHERRVGECLREALPTVPISLASELLAEFREYERMSTVCANAYLIPRLASYLRKLSAEASDHGLPEPLVMQSSGGVADVAAAAAEPARFVLSGPAGGVIGASYIAAMSGYRNLLTFDMGGTSTDVAPVLGGMVQTTTESVVAGVPLRLPMVDVHSVSAGGGSIAWVDDGGALRVGPRSAGADPGPAAYGLGGDEPTVTDANLVLGILADDAVLGGKLRLSRDAARRVLARLGDQLGLTAEEASVGVLRVANSEMINALRLISVERGLDPRGFALVAFGGAGGMHVCALAEELGTPTVLVPRACGVLSALGLAVSDLRRDFVSPLLRRVDELAPARLESAWRALAHRARSDLGREGSTVRTDQLADLRYRGQSYELTVSGESPEMLTEAFHKAHEQRYGYQEENEIVEIVNVRLTAQVAGQKPVLVEPNPAVAGPHTDRREIFLDGQWQSADVVDRALMGRGSPVTGPAVIEFSEATCLVRRGWTGIIDRVGTLVLHREQR